MLPVAHADVVANTVDVIIVIVAAVTAVAADNANENRASDEDVAGIVTRGFPDEYIAKFHTRYPIKRNSE